MQFIRFLFLFVFVFILVMPISVYSELDEKNLETHIHVNLKMEKGGHDIKVPAKIGIDPRLWKNDSFDRYSLDPKHISALHTHETDGKIHIESTVFSRFKLDDFLRVWGMDQTKIENVNSDGKSIKLVDYKTLPLQNGQNLTIKIKSDNFPKKNLHFVDSNFGLSFYYPSDWNLTTSDYRQQTMPGERLFYVIQLYPEEGNFLNAPFLIPNLRIEIYKLSSGNMTLDQYIVANLPNVLQGNNQHHPKAVEFPNSITSIPFRFDGNYAQKIISVTGEQKKMEIMTMKKDLVYVISYNGVLSDNVTSYTYDSYWSTVEKLLNSIRIN